MDSLASHNAAKRLYFMLPKFACTPSEPEGLGGEGYKLTAVNLLAGAAGDDGRRTSLTPRTLHDI